MGRPRPWGDRGAAAVELALILPVLLLLIGGVVDFGRAFFAQIIITNAAAEGARAGVVRADPVVRANAAGALAPGWVNPPTVVGNCTTTATTPASPSISVTTSATFSYFFLNAIPGVTSPTTLRSTATMRCV